MSILTYNGKAITQRDTDNYVNATEMCKANGKLFAHWMENKDSKRYLEATSVSIGIPIDKLIYTKEGRPDRGGGTWIHPKLAIKLGRWISVDFELWCDEHIRTLIATGQTSIIQTPQQQYGVYGLRSKAWFENKLPKGYWCVFNESTRVLLYVEGKLKLPVGRYDLLDGSIGKRWANHRKGQEWAGEPQKFPYKFPDGRHCHPWCYPDSELLQFRSFLDEVYTPKFLPEYLETKYPGLIKAE